MEAGRFIVPMIPIASAFIVSAVYSFLTEWSKYIALFSISILALSTNVNIVEYQSTGVSIIHRENYTKKLSNKLSNNGTRIDSYSWFEKYNKVHARDLISIQRISHIINNYEKNDELHILSGQMGIVMYHISKKFREKISIIDNHNLTTNKISRCDPEGLKVGRSGSHVSIEKIITNMDYYENRCNLEDPDIIYDLESEYSNDLKKSGYKVVFDQTGYMSPLRKYFQGDRVKSDQFIMLDKSVKGLSDNIRFNKVGYLY